MVEVEICGQILNVFGTMMLMDMKENGFCQNNLNTAFATYLDGENYSRSKF